MKKFYASFYGPSNAELAVVGDFDEQEVNQFTTALSSNWKSRQPYARIVRPYREVPMVNDSG